MGTACAAPVKKKTNALTNVPIRIQLTFSFAVRAVIKRTQLMLEEVETSCFSDRRHEKGIQLHFAVWERTGRPFVGANCPEW